MFQKRRHVTTACEHCRRRKAKCSGQTPCQRCQKYGYECKFVAPTKKRGPAKTYYDTIEPKLRRIEKARTYLDASNHISHLSEEASANFVLPKIISSSPPRTFNFYQYGPSSDLDQCRIKSISIYDGQDCPNSQCLDHRTDVFISNMWPPFNHNQLTVVKEAEICKECPPNMPTSNPPTPPTPSIPSHQYPLTSFSFSSLAHHQELRAHHQELRAPYQSKDDMLQDQSYRISESGFRREHLTPTSYIRDRPNGEFPPIDVSSRFNDMYLPTRLHIINRK